MSGMSIHQALYGMLIELPPAGEKWPQEKIDEWLEAFGAVVRLVHQDGKSRMPMTRRIRLSELVLQAAQNGHMCGLLREELSNAENP